MIICKRCAGVKCWLTLTGAEKPLNNVTMLASSTLEKVIEADSVDITTTPFPWSSLANIREPSTSRHSYFIGNTSGCFSGWADVVGVFCTNCNVNKRFSLSYDCSTVTTGVPD